MLSIHLLNFNEKDCKNPNLTGGKGASLANMTQVGLPVPPGFVLSTSLFEDFIKTNKLDFEIENRLEIASKSLENQEKLENISREISDLILNQQLDTDLQLQIKNQFKNLDSTWVAVRSSATSEDGAESAWAGQLDSFLNTDEQSLIENIKKCWASLFSPRALFYRFEKGFVVGKISIAVVIQSMIQSEVSGIAFTVHPVTEDRNIILIEAGFGLGEAIVSGQITPDSFEIGKANLDILDQQRNDQTRGIFLDESGNNVWKNTTDDSSIKSNLAENHVLELAKICIKIEKYYGFPCDIEWAFYQNQFYIVQSRPITTLTLSDSDYTNRLKNINDILSVSWKKVWTTEYSVFSIWEFAKGYTKYCTEILGFSFDKIILTREKNLATVFRNEKELEDFSLKALRKILDNDFLTKASNTINLLNTELLSFTDLSAEEFLTDSLSAFIEIHNQFLPYFLLFLWAPDSIQNLNSISNQEKNYIFEICLKNRKKTEHTYPDLEFFLNKVFSYIEKKEDLPKFHARCLLPQELLKYVVDKVLPGKTILQQRFECVGVIALGKNICLTNESQTRGIYGKVTYFKNDDEVLRGKVANSGFCVGRCRIIFDFESMKEFQTDEILVTTMTRPEWLPAIKNSKAIITDAGGVLCHASIISRELKKPCIIDTKIATQVLKDGDLVEVDADNGVVKILEKAKETYHND